MRNHFLRNIFAIFVILFGVFLVFNNLNIVSWNMDQAWGFVYPTFFVLLGIKWIIDFFKGHGGFASGTFLLVFGLLLLLDRFNVLSFTFFDVYKLWPLLLVYIGFSIFKSANKKNRKRKFQFVFDSARPIKDTKGNAKKQRFVIGDHTFNQSNWTVEPMDLWNAIGDYHIDFTKAFIPDKEIPISIQGWAGDIRILIPENIEFTLEAQVKAGDIHVFGQDVDGINRNLTYETHGFADATRKLNIFLRLKAGSIKVDKV
ncbi:cell wall-active antibiotics response protein LiaF [Terrihalobacillus insolitus]|uniref:cell wall-active antibiotics response protein LiaF n=1 Tax=Terrihalobacillus insolitus TaxID=2950438 RepID=UPI0023406DB9|nr:cell wall-active antibiotics response protein LiaF [Terrihalobacillus insolitus]MDC3413751.1 cell wall-active antibiotics response protein LiaF [Terrihalobacillus insolitus]